MSDLFLKLLRAPRLVMLWMYILVALAATPFIIFINTNMVICGAALVIMQLLGTEEFPAVVWVPCIIASGLVTVSVMFHWWEESRGSRVSHTGLRRGGRRLEDDRR